MRLGFISTVNLHVTPADPGEIVMFSRPMRLTFISTVNLNVTLADPGEIVMFFNEKCAPYHPPQIPCVFSGKLRLAFTVPLNSNDTRPTASGFRIFFQLKIRHGNMCFLK